MKEKNTKEQCRAKHDSILLNLRARSSSRAKFWRLLEANTEHSSVDFLSCHCHRVFLGLAKGRVPR